MLSSRNESSPSSAPDAELAESDESDSTTFRLVAAVRPPLVAAAELRAGMVVHEEIEAIDKGATDHRLSSPTQSMDVIVSHPLFAFGYPSMPPPLPPPLKSIAQGDAGVCCLFCLCSVSKEGAGTRSRATVERGGRGGRRDGEGGGGGRPRCLYTSLISPGMHRTGGRGTPFVLGIKVGNPQPQSPLPLSWSRVRSPPATGKRTKVRVTFPPPLCARLPRKKQLAGAE